MEAEHRQNHPIVHIFPSMLHGSQPAALINLR
jgi:hypothetical protein